MDSAIQICQCENRPFEMTKSSVQPMSVPKRHIPKTRAITARGVSKAETACAASRETLAVLSKADCISELPSTAESPVVIDRRSRFVFMVHLPLVHDD